MNFKKLKNPPLNDIFKAIFVLQVNHAFLMIDSEYRFLIS